MIEPTSDGTMRCPVSEAYSGLPCQKRIPVGWTAAQGHGGGHWWQDDESFERMQTAHYDARALLSGQPVTMHDPEECPGPPECRTWRYPPAAPTSTTTEPAQPGDTTKETTHP